MTEIRIFLNGEPRLVPDDIDVARLLDLFALPQQRVAIELNKDVVRRALWTDTPVRENDRIEVVHFVGGG